MNILVVSSYLPYPLHSGGNIRLYNLLRLLSKKHTITLICETRSHQTRQDIGEVEKICKQVITVPRKKQWSIKNIAQTGVSRNAFLINGHTNLAMKDMITSIIYTQDIDLIHVETSYVLQNIPATKIPIILVEHNIEYLVYQRYLEKAPAFLRPILKIDIIKLKKFEEQAWKRVTYVAAVSPQEKNIIEKITPQVTVIPNGVNLETFSFKPITSFLKTDGEKRVLFIGDFKWLQNKDSVHWILKNIWPLIKNQFADDNIKFWIVGKHIPESIKSIKDPDVIVEEDAPSASDVFQQAYILLATIRVGGGTSYKILESMASGTPVITTSLGLEGIMAEKNKDVFVADQPLEILTTIDKFLHDKKLYSATAVNAREKIEQNYSWEMIAKDLDSLYRKVASNRK